MAEQRKLRKEQEELQQHQAQMRGGTRPEVPTVGQKYTRAVQTIPTFLNKV